MDKTELNDFCELLMCSDPDPLPPGALDRLKAVADREAKSLGYADWIEAYHRLASPK